MTFFLQTSPIPSGLLPLDNSGDTQLFFHIAYKVRPTIGGKPAPTAGKPSRASVRTSIHLWENNRSAVRSDFSEKLAGLGIDPSHHARVVRMIESSVGPNLGLVRAADKAVGLLVEIVNVRPYPDLRLVVAGVPDEGKICGVCSEKTAEGGAKTPCNHMFHVNCIVNWLQLEEGACPLCGSRFNDY